MRTYTFKLETQHKTHGTELPSYVTCKAANLNAAFRRVAKETGELEARPFWKQREIVSLTFWAAE